MKEVKKPCHDSLREFGGGIPEGAEFVMCLECGVFIKAEVEKK